MKSKQAEAKNERKYLFGDMRTIVQVHGFQYHHRYGIYSPSGKKVYYFYTINIPRGLEKVMDEVVKLPEKEQDNYMRNNLTIYPRFSDEMNFTLRKLSWEMDIDYYWEVEKPETKIMVPYLEVQRVYHGKVEEEDVQKVVEGIDNLGKNSFTPCCILYLSKPVIEVSHQGKIAAEEENLKLLTLDEVQGKTLWKEPYDNFEI